MKPVSKSKLEIVRVANLLPYPFIITEIKKHDDEFETLFFNENLIKEFGYTTDDIHDVDTWYELLYPDENYRNEIRNDWNTQIEEAISKNERFVKIKARLKPKNQEEKWYEIKSFFIDNFYILAFIDINNEVVLQKELTEVNKNNGRMLSILGHDLRNPIANLSAISSMVKTDDITIEEFKSMVETINQKSNQLLEMIDTTLNWTKLNFNAISLIPVQINYKLLVTGIVALFKSMLENKRIVLHVDLDNFHTKNCDIEVITTIIRNLLSNAIKFTPNNGKISIYHIYNQLVVKDSGVGMSQEKIENIKNYYYKSCHGTANETGMGMGFQLVLELAKKINCKIEIDSEVGIGTKVKVVF